MQKRERTFLDDLKEVGAFFWVGIGIAIGFISAAIVFDTSAVIRGFVDNLVPGAIEIAFTVFVIDQLAERRAKREAREDLKQRLIRQMGSSVHEEAIRAVEELEAHGWSKDGSLEGADLAVAKLHGASLAAFNLKGAKLFGANLKGANLFWSNLQEVLLLMANLQVATLWRANLQMANLSGANFFGANIRQANLKEANLTRANLEGANMSQTNLQGANFEGAKFDEETILPDEMKWTPDIDMSRFTDPNHPDFWRPSPDEYGDYPPWYTPDEDANS